MRDEASTILRWVGINIDIHDRKLADAESAEILRVFIDSVKDYAIFMIDARGNVRSWNPGAQRIKQYSTAEAIGQHFSIFYTEEAIAGGTPARELEVATREGRFEDESVRVRKDGSLFWAHVIISAMRGADGALIGFSKVTRDLTEAKRAEAGRLRLLQAEEAVRLRDEFLSIASHELKTPLNSLQLLTSSILRGAAGRALDPKPAFWRPLLLEAALLFCFASISVGVGHPPHINSFSMTSLICFGMGVQNALVTKLSGARIRTTHL